MSNKLLTLDDIPDIMSSSLSILQDEIDRIATTPKHKRNSTDIKTILACITTLANVMKVKQAEEKQATMTINMLPTNQLQAIVASGGRPTHQLPTKTHPTGILEPANTIWEERDGIPINNKDI